MPLLEQPLFTINVNFIMFVVLKWKVTWTSSMKLDIQRKITNNMTYQETDKGITKSLVPLMNTSSDC